MSLRDKAAITGVGETEYSRNSGQSVVALQMQASLAAIADAGLTPKDIDGIIAYGASGVVAEDFVTNFGIPDLALLGDDADGRRQLRRRRAVRGRRDRDRHLQARPDPARPQRRLGQPHRRAHPRRCRSSASSASSRCRSGAIAPAQLYAPMARRHMELYGTTSRPARRDRGDDPPARRRSTATP